MCPPPLFTYCILKYHADILDNTIPTVHQLIRQFVSLQGHKDSKVYFSYFKMKTTSLGLYRLFFYIYSDHLGCKIESLAKDINLEVTQ